MKKLFGIFGFAALLVAFSPLTQAQGVYGHPDARNDRVERRVVVRRAPPPKVHHHRHHRPHHPVHR